VKDSVLIKFAFVAASLLVTAFGQNPVPQIVGPVKPMAVAPGRGAFILTVYGANFVPGAIVNWNGHARSTEFVSARKLLATIPTTDVAENTAGLISVTNPPPGGGNSSAGWAQVEVHGPTTSFAFKHTRKYSLGGYLLLPADFNNDGVLDLVGQYGDLLDFNPGSGDGTFHFGSVAARYYDSNGGAYGDFNGDGNLDLAFGQSPPDSQTLNVEVVLGDGTGRFHSGTEITNAEDSSLSTGFIVAGDFNRDGHLDLVVSNLQGFSLFLGDGKGGFSHFIDVVDSNPVIAGMLAGDFNGDGILDIALLAEGGASGTYLYMFTGNGDGTFAGQQEVLASPDIMQGGDIELTDVNHDGKLDLTFRTDSQVCVLMGKGDGTFRPPQCTTVGTGFQFTYAVGDINSDGKPDLIVSNYFNFNQSELDLYLGNGDGTFQSPQAVLAPEAELGIVLGDFDADGLLDIIFQTGVGSDALIQARR